MAGNALTPERQAQLLQAFNQAVQLHAAGRVAQAAQVYETLLKDIPGHADVLDLYGTALFQLGAPETGRPYVLASLKRRPLWSPAWNHLGAIERGLRDDGAGERAFIRAMLVDPSSAEPCVNLAAIHGDQGRAASGLRLNRRAFVANPASPDAELRQGVLLRLAGRAGDAIPFLEAAWRRQPGNTEVALNLARANIDLGHLANARQIVMAGIVFAPQSHELYGSIATSHDPRWATDADVAWARYATRIRPLEQRSWLNLAAETYRDGRMEEAYAASRQAVMLDPASDSGLRNLSAAAIGRHRLVYAREVLRRFLAISPGNAEALYNLSETEFRVGDARQALDLHEARLQRDMHRPRLNLPEPWAGPGTETGPVLIASEQGVGDEVTFLACLAAIFDDITQPVIIEVDSRLVSLIQRTFPKATVVPRQFVPGDGLGQFFDYGELVPRYGIRHYISSGSLMRLMGRGRDQGLDRVGYLALDPERVAHWRHWLDGLGTAPTVGVVWRTAHWTRFRARNHCRIEDLLPVFSLPGLTFVNLMVGNNSEELATVKAACGVEMVRPPGLDIWDGLEDLVALMSGLDAVVAARTANCAFAGAAGVPTVRLAQSFMYISDRREFFFPNVYPVFERAERFDGPLAGRRAAACLTRILQTGSDAS